MKRRIIALIILTVLAIALPTILTACDGEKAEYSVTLVSSDKQPLQNVTVKWVSGDKVAGTATTDAEGKATASISMGTYTVELEGYPEELAYEPVQVTSSERSIRLTLSVKTVEYSVTVIDKEGSPAQNVTVNWMNDGQLAGTATTDANGKAVKELAYGQYTVSLNNLPQNNVYDGQKTVTGASPAVEFVLRDGMTQEYVVTVKSEGGLLFKQQAVNVFFKGDDLAVTSGVTDENGQYRFTYEARDYVVEAVRLPDGYTGASVELTASSPEATIELHSEVIKTAPASDLTYVIGDIIHDYEFTTPYELNGEKWSSSVSEILKTKDAIIINNWGLNCSWCVTEMPDMQEVYEQYSDQIEIIAVNNFSRQPDSDSEITNFQQSRDITFPMMRDTNGFAAKFALTNWPTTIVIDRYGAIARIEVGAVLGTEAWERMILKYIGNGYVQDFVPGEHVSDSINNEVAKPDVELDDDHYTTQVPAALHDTGTFPQGTSVTWRGETEYEYAWPFVIGNDANVSQTPYLYASNINKPNSMAIIYADVTVNAGHVLTFEYYVDSEQYDALNLLWDGRIIRKLSGSNNNKGWQTCYLFSEITNGDHTLALAYIKDSSGNDGIDNVYIRNLHFVDIATLTDESEPVDMLRGAAYGQLKENDMQFPYYAETYPDENDGYYHVRLSSLENANIAGNDEDPLLFANLLNVTPWSTQLSINQLVMGVDENGEYITDCSFALADGIVRDYRSEFARYLRAAGASTVEDMVPVNKRLHDLLVGYMATLSGTYWHENEWLEICYFYSHYGTGEAVGNSIMGVMTETAITLEENTRVTANLTRNMYPFPTEIYAFTPETSGLYKFESFIPVSTKPQEQQYASQIWLYDLNSSPEKALAYSGSERINIDAKNEQNFELYYNLEGGHKYYVEVAFQMQERGTFEFSVTRIEQDVTIWEPASGDTYAGIFDEDGKLTGMTLEGAIEYELGEDNYYHVKGDPTAYIYIDVTRIKTSALSIPLSTLVDQNVQTPLLDEDGKFISTDYKYFDFRYCFMYYHHYENGENTWDGLIPKVDLQNEQYPEYKDYTAIMKAYIEQAPVDGEYAGLIKVDKDLADIIKMFFELRINGVWTEAVENEDGTATPTGSYEVEASIENEWLRFCWYRKTYKAEEEQQQN